MCHLSHVRGHTGEDTAAPALLTVAESIYTPEIIKRMLEEKRASFCITAFLK